MRVGSGRVGLDRVNLTFENCEITNRVGHRIIQFSLMSRFWACRIRSGIDFLIQFDSDWFQIRLNESCYISKVTSNVHDNVRISLNFKM